MIDEVLGSKFQIFRIPRIPIRFTLIAFSPQFRKNVRLSGEDE